MLMLSKHEGKGLRLPFENLRVTALQTMLHKVKEPVTNVHRHFYIN
jgi:hypothetical protein